MAITKLPSGKYQHDYRVDGRRRYRRFRTRAEALAHQLQIDTAKAGGTLVDTRKGGRISVQRLYEEWIARIEDVGARGARPSSPVTVAGYRRIYDNHIKPHFEFRPLAQVSLQVVNTWLDTFNADDARQRSYRQLGRMMQYAVDSGYIAVNPARNPKLNHVRTPTPVRERAALTVSQLEALADQCALQAGGEPQGLRCKALVLLAGTTGLRWGEIAGLKPDCLVLGTQAAVTVRRTLVPVDGRLLLQETTKGRRPRTVPIPAFVKELLSEVMEHHSGTGLVFTSPNGSELRSSNFARRTLHPAVRACQAADPSFPDMVFHDLRRTAVSLANSAGVNVKIIQQIAGHQSATTTLDVYAQIFADDLHASALAVDALFNDTRPVDPASA